LSRSDNQLDGPATIKKKAATNKILAKRENQHDHHFATGRRFITPSAVTFSSRLSRNTPGLFSTTASQTSMRELSGWGLGHNTGSARGEQQ
jgi:hypothetical protein